MLEKVERPATGTGPLDGETVVVKELVAIGGHQLSANTDVVLPDHWAHPAEDSAIVAALRKGGARVVGTTTTHEFAWGITTYGRGRRVENPVMPGRIAGGSSGGSAESVAFGEASIGIGTDTAGSVRIPAAWCHLVGWKFTEGLIPMDGILPLSPGLDHPGLLAREPEVLLRAAGAFGAQQSSFQPKILTPPSEFMRLGDPAALGIVADAVRILADERGLSAGVAEHFPSREEIVTCFSLVQGPAVVLAHRDMIGTWPAQRDRYPDYIVQRLEAAEERSRAEVDTGQRLQAHIRLRLNDLLENAVIVLPATGCAPPITTYPDEIVIEGQRHDLRSVVLPNTIPANLAGLPAVVVPFRSDGSEFGVQLLGPAGSDVLLLELASVIMARGT